MKSSTAFIIAAAVSAANAGPASYKFPIQRRIAAGARISANTGPVSTFSVASGGGGANSSDIVNINDISYTTPITVCGQKVTCLLDTGSTDLWVKPSSALSGAKDTGKSTKIVYGSGDVAGPIQICPVTLGSYSLPNQAFINIASGKVDNLFIQNIFGIIGLGFDSLSKVNGAFSDTTGRSLLTNLFYANPKTPNYVAFLLDRASDLDEVAEGSFTVGEVESQYAAVMQQPALPVFPDANVARWNIVLDGISVNGVNVPLKSSVKGAPAGKTIALLDTGTSLVYGPAAAVEAIYKAIPGSSYYQEGGYWLVDCLSSSTVEFNFAGVKVNIHPLDLTMVSTVNLNDGTTGSSCRAAIRANTIDAGAGELDWLMGDTFLRNAYVVYDFGDIQGETGGLVGHPFIKLLPLPASAPTVAAPEFKTARSFALSKLPPTVDPVVLTGYAQQDDPNGNQGAGTPASVTLAALAQDMHQVTQYLPVVLGLLGANVLVVLVLLIVGCVFFFKRRGGGKGRSYQPVTH